MIHPSIFNTSQICYQLGVRHAVMSPGSRNAPLTISFARHQKIKKWIIPDERSAGFIGLGIAQQTKTPVVLCCTSGTALLNYAPAVAEAYYREIPLIILSADRPPELIDQRDGQTIRQFESLKNHVKGSAQLPVVTTNDHTEAKLFQAQLIEYVLMANRQPIGPVHINVPFREPFYPKKEEIFTFESVAIPQCDNDYAKQESQLPNISDYKKILILIGQHDEDVELSELLKPLAEKVPVIRSPLNNLQIGINHVDAFIDKQANLTPDLLITSGLSVLSKKLKTYLKTHQPTQHFHFDPAGVPVDTFLSQPKLIKNSIKSFLKDMSVRNVDTEYLNQWKAYEASTYQEIISFLSTSPFSESKAVHTVLSHIPENNLLHLSNSMSVRYADLFGVKNKITCMSNRGTSGIDGCTSTALGSALVSSQMNTLLTGDLAFLYDRNAFFHNYQLPNLRVIVLNNNGGGIFRLIEGPATLPELEDYFETRHNRTAQYICAENKMEYLQAKDEASLLQCIKDFYNPSKTAKVLEIFTNPEVNQTVFKSFKNHIHEQINN